MKYILEISDSFYARDNECKHSLSSRLTKEFFEYYPCGSTLGIPKGNASQLACRRTFHFSFFTFHSER